MLLCVLLQCKLAIHYVIKFLIYSYDAFKNSNRSSLSRIIEPKL